jgi:hypothetical protein
MFGTVLLVLITGLSLGFCVGFFLGVTALRWAMLRNGKTEEEIRQFTGLDD